MTLSLALLASPVLLMFSFTFMSDVQFLAWLILALTLSVRTQAEPRCADPRWIDRGRVRDRNAPGRGRNSRWLARNRPAFIPEREAVGSHCGSRSNIAHRGNSMAAVARRRGAEFYPIVSARRAARIPDTATS